MSKACTDCGKRRTLYVPENTWGQALCKPCFDKFVVSRTRLSPSGRKRCPYCKKYKALKEFQIDHSRGYYLAYCHPCRNQVAQDNRLFFNIPTKI